MELIEHPSAFPFAETVQRVTAAIEGAGFFVITRIDHQAAAQKTGLEMPPTLVIVYGNPKGGTPLMLAAPKIALDLPARMLVRDDSSGNCIVSWHPAIHAIRAAGLPDDSAAKLQAVETAIAAAVQG